MKVEQKIEGTDAGKDIRQNTDGEMSNVSQAMKGVKTKGAIDQKATNSQLRIKGMSASGTIAVIVLGVVVLAYFAYKYFSR